MVLNNKIAGFIIDCPTNDLVAAGNFWSKALNLKIVNPNEDGKYVVFESQNGLHFEVQKTKLDSIPKIHIDIKTNDLEKECERLTKLGAKKISDHASGDWIIMEAPTGHRFCVIKEKSLGRTETFTKWDYYRLLRTAEHFNNDIKKYLHYVVSTLIILFIIIIIIMEVLNVLSLTLLSQVLLLLLPIPFLLLIRGSFVHAKRKQNELSNMIVLLDELKALVLTKAEIKIVDYKLSFIGMSPLSFSSFFKPF